MTKKKADNFKVCRRPLPLIHINKYLLNELTPSRILCDISIVEILTQLKGNIIEIGATKSTNYSKFAISSDNYIIANIQGDCDQYMDAMNLPYRDNSIDCFVCAVVLEHIKDPWGAIEEMHRVLKPNGNILVVLPFIYFYHAAPDDYYRFSSSALVEMFKNFDVLRVEYLGGRESTIALFLQNMGGFFIKNYFARFLGSLFYLLDCKSRTIDDSPILLTMFAEKKREYYE